MLGPERSRQLNEPLSPQDKQRISDFYGVSSASSWRRNPRGLVNVGYEIGDNFFLTLYGRRTQDQIEACAEVANAMRDSIPIARPTKGQMRYALQLDKGSTLLAHRLPGRHYVGIAHTQKDPIPLDLHATLATFFWQVQEELSAVPDSLKARLAVLGVMNVDDWVEKVPNIATPLLRFAPVEGIPEFKYPDLIHDDLERQNILSVGNAVTGLVDLDSIRTGDVLYEYGHFLFNNVLCDPNVNTAILTIYIDELLKAGRINPIDLQSLYGHIYQFAISDAIEFNAISSDPVSSQHRMINMSLLIQQYERALSVASDYFNNGHIRQDAKASIGLQLDESISDV